MSLKPTIAVVGSGISGLFSAYFLSQHYQVTLFEQNNYYGGHSNTININYDGLNIDVDTGFIVFNKQTYPNFLQFYLFLMLLISQVKCLLLCKFFINKKLY
jgi:predicted NAD/FAD-binding protein